MAIVALGASAAIQGPASAHTHTAAKPTRAQQELLSRVPASAAVLQKQIDLQLSLYPGGKQTSANEVSYDGGNFVITFAKPATTQPSLLSGKGDCPDGWFCFWDYEYYGGAMGKLSSYGAQDLWRYGWSDRIESAWNRTNTVVRFYNHTTGSHSEYAISSYDQYLFMVFPGDYDTSVKYLADGEDSERNKADHVYRCGGPGGSMC
ncbi:peptidase inhibitor family I36 protein [Longispora albida]|uniref:peptidase inhibitor family I36 protein n=1 Tax=Longispora albida TaxID=203523 RepID=UPI00036C8032|nr:peptidase inhibitor family I36 protein [Longispora albida]